MSTTTSDNDNLPYQEPLLPSQELLTPAQAAVFKGVSRTAVYSAIAENRLPHIRVLGRLAVKKADVLAWKPIRYAGRSKGFVVEPETRQKMSQARKRYWQQKPR